MKWPDSFEYYKLTEKLKTSINSLSTKLVYSLFLLFYAYKNENTPSWAKNIILGAFAYFISPIDSIPDLTPFIGFTDDLSLVSFGLVTIACYIDNSVREKALDNTTKLMGKVVSNKDIEEVDLWL